jgi:hypothetical protein
MYYSMIKFIILVFTKIDSIIYDGNKAVDFNNRTLMLSFNGDYYLDCWTGIYNNLYTGKICDGIILNHDFQHIWNRY